MRQLAPSTSWIILSAAILAGSLGDSAEPSPRQPALNDLAGDWEVASADASAGETLVFPEETGLARVGSQVTIRGNALIHDEKTVATLTTDFSATGLNLEKQVWIKRRPILLTQPDGKGILCAYFASENHVELVYPHTLGRVGAGSWLSLKRAEKR